MKSIGYAIAPEIECEQPQNIVCLGPPGTGKMVHRIFSKKIGISNSRLLSCLLLPLP